MERLGWGRRLSIHVHLLMCRHCNRYASQLRALGSSIRVLFATSSDEKQRLRNLERKILKAAFGEGSDGAASS